MASTAAGGGDVVGAGASSRRPRASRPANQPTIGRFHTTTASATMMMMMSRMARRIGAIFSLSLPLLRLLAATLLLLASWKVKKLLWRLDWRCPNSQHDLIFRAGRLQSAQLGPPQARVPKWAKIGQVDFGAPFCCVCVLARSNWPLAVANWQLGQESPQEMCRAHASRRAPDDGRGLLEANAQSIITKPPQIQLASLAMHQNVV